MESLQHSFEIFDDLIVPEPQRQKSSFPKIPVALEVTHATVVLPSIYFDDDPCTKRYEIDNVSPHRLLALELESLKPFAAQLAPKARLSVRHRRAQPAGKWQQGRPQVQSLPSNTCTGAHSGRSSSNELRLGARSTAVANNASGM